MIIIASVFVAQTLFALLTPYIADRRSVNHERLVQMDEKRKFESLSAEDKAIKRAEEYLVRNIQGVEAGNRLFLDYIQRKFQLDDILGTAESPIVSPTDKRSYPQEYDYLERLAYPEKLVSSPPNFSLEGPALTNIYSANCDHLKTPRSFWATMEDSNNHGGYNTTHVALALMFIKDNGCDIPPGEGDLIMRVAQNMVVIINDKSTMPDLRYESVAFLLMISRYDLIEPEWIDAIVSEQLPNGGWALEKDQPANAHASLLALWSLLEYKNPDKPYTPIIQHPA